MYDFPLLQGGVGGICAVCPNQAGEGVCPSVSHHAPTAAEGHQRIIGSANRALSRQKNVDNCNNTLRSLYYYIIIIMIALSRKLMCKNLQCVFFLMGCLVTTGFNKNPYLFNHIFVLLGAAE